MYIRLWQALRSPLAWDTADHDINMSERFTATSENVYHIRATFQEKCNIVQLRISYKLHVRE